jgi:hypothetical protein
MAKKTSINGITYQEFFKPDKESMIKALKIILECQPCQDKREKEEKSA